MFNCVYTIYHLTQAVELYLTQSVFSQIYCLSSLNKQMYMQIVSKTWNEPLVTIYLTYISMYYLPKYATYLESNSWIRVMSRHVTVLSNFSIINYFTADLL